MAQSIAELLVNVGVKVKDADKAQKDVAGLTKSTDKLGKSAGKSGGRLKKMGGALKTMAKGAAIAAAAVAGIGIAIFKFVDAQTKALDQTAKMSRALGISAEEMQRLNFAFSQSGVSAGAGQKAILKLNEQVLKLSTGQISRSSKAFEELGITFKDLEGKTATQQLGLISDHLLTVDDLARRSALSATLLGKSAGPELATLIAGGSAGLDQLAASTENVLTGEQLERAELFQDAMGRMDQFMTGLAQTIAVELAPPITAIIDGVREWVKENREFIDSGVDVFLGLLGEVFNAVVDEVKLMIAILKPLIGVVIDVVKWVDDATGIFTLWKKVVLSLFTPLRTLRELAVKVAKALESVGVLSEGSADRFAASMGRIDESSKALDNVTERANDATVALTQLEVQQLVSTSFGSGKQTQTRNRKATPAEKRAIAAEKRKNDAIAAKNIRDRKAKGGGKPPKKPKTKKEPKAPPPGVSLEQLDRELFSGNIENIAERIRGIAVPGSVAAAEPQVAIEFQEFNIGPITVNATGTDNEIGDAVGARIRREFDKKIAETAQRMKSKVKA